MADLSNRLSKAFVPVKFVKVEMDEALAARRARAELLAAVRSHLTSSP